MSNQIRKDGGAAFPHMMAEGHRDYAGGMTLRDYFAGQALASIPNRSWDDVGDGYVLVKAWAKCAYAVADAMLAARIPQETTDAK